MILTANDREFRMLEIIDRLRICRANDLAWMAGYTDYTYCRKGLKKLEDMGFLQVARDSVGAKCYFLTYRGLSELGKHKTHTYEVSSTTNHALTVAKVCAWLCATKNACIFDMITDGGLRQAYAKKAHCPDIVYNSIGYEVELNHKKRSVLECNVLANEQFNQQIWIVPDNRNNISNNLMLASKATAVPLEIMKLSEIDAAIAAADIHSNSYHASLGIVETFATPELPTAGKYSSYFNALEDTK